MNQPVDFLLTIICLHVQGTGRKERERERELETARERTKKLLTSFQVSDLTSHATIGSLGLCQLLPSSTLLLIS